MSSKTQFFSIPNIIKFAVVDHKGYFNRIFDTFNIHYENFKTDGKIEDCNLIIEIGKFDPDLENKYVVGNKMYYFGEDFLYISGESYKGAKWRFQVQGLNNVTTIAKIDCNTIGRIFTTGNVIDFLIHLKLLEQGYPIIHASAVTKNDKAFIFTSRGGGGKTTVALELVSNGFDFIGDNYVMIHKGEVIAFPTSLSIFTYNLAPIITKGMKLKERISLALKSAIYKGTMGHAKIFTKINPERIFDDIASSSKLHTGFLLIPHTNNTSDQIFVEEVDFYEFIDKIRYNQMLEFPFFSKYIEEYSYLFPNANLSLHWEKYKESLIKNFSKEKTIYYKIIVPQRYNDSVFKEISELVNCDHKKL